MNTTTCNGGVEPEQPKNNYKAEGEEFIKKLKDKNSGAKYCYQFFYDTEELDKRGQMKKKDCQIAPMRSKMIYDIKKNYKVDVKPEDISSILYLTLWGDGSWSVLDSYEGRSSFFAWLRTVARNAVMDRLLDEHIIENVRSRTVGNTCLALQSEAPSRCKMIIDDLMVGSKYHRLLTAIYVERLSEEMIMEKLNIKDATEYDAVVKAAENRLKDALLRSVEYAEANVLRDKKKQVVKVSSEFVADMSEWVKAKTGVNPLSDVFGANLTGEELCQKTVEFLYDFSAKLWPEKIDPDKVKDEQKRKEKEEKNKLNRYIWCERFIKETRAVDVAEKVGHDRGWLDTRYSRLNKIFAKAIREWWKSHAA